MYFLRSWVSQCQSASHTRASSAPWISHRQSVSHTRASSAPWVSQCQSVSHTRASSAPWVSHRQSISHTRVSSVPWVSHRQSVSHTHAFSATWVSQCQSASHTRADVRCKVHDKKRISLARFSACGGSLLRHVSIPTQCEPRGAFLSYRNEVFYMIKKLPPCNRTRVNHYRFIPPLTHTNIRVPFNGGKPASLTFLSQFYLNRKFQAATPE